MNNAEPPTYTHGDKVAVVESFKPGSPGAVFSHDLVRDALVAIHGANPPLSPSKRAVDRCAAPVIAQAIASHRGGKASEAEGAAILDHLKRSGLVGVEQVAINRGRKGSDTRQGLVLTAAGKSAIQEVTQ
jgi:hypothetical protein